MELNSNPAGSEANEVSFINFGALPRWLLRKTGTSEHDCSEGAVLWSGTACGDLGASPTGLVQQTLRLRGHGGSDVQTGAGKRSSGVGRFNRGSCLHCRPERGAVGA